MLLNRKARRAAASQRPATLALPGIVWAVSMALASGAAVAAPAAAGVKATAPLPMAAATPGATSSAPAGRTPAAGAEAAPARMSVLQGSPCERVDIAPLVQIPVGKSTVIRPSSPVARILLGNPENAQAARPSDPADSKPGDPARSPAAAPTSSGGARPGVADVDVLLLGPTEIYLLGKSLGSTNVVMIDRNRNCTAFDVVVGMDVTGLRAVLSQLLPEEKSIKVSAAFDSVVLSGSVSDPEALARLTDLANAYVRGQGAGGASAAKNARIINMMEVDSPQQVMLEVKVAEVSKALIDKLGVSVGARNGNGNWNYALLANFLSGGSAGLTAVKAISGTSISLDAQKDDGLVKVLAEPTIMAISGQTGSFLAGGKIFIPVSQSTDNGGRTTTLEEKEFGVSVKFTPTVLGGGRINLRVRPEVSELSRDGVTLVSSTASGTAILPSFTSRKAETTVQLMDGQSFAIGGLIKNNTSTNIKAFPILGELPVIGALFRSSSFQTDRSELVFVVTPRLVKPVGGNIQLPTDSYVPPNREELFLEGKLEGRRPPAPAPAPFPDTPVTGGGFDTRPTLPVEKK